MRIAVARGLVVLAVILVVVSLLAGFVRFQGLDTETVSETASTLIADEEIRDQVAATLVEQFYAHVDVEAAIAERLAPEQQGLSGVAAAGVRELFGRGAVRMLERPRVQELWVDIVTRAHRQLIIVLDDDALLTTDDGAVVLDARPLVIELGERVAVIGEVSERFGPDAGRIEVMEAGQLETAQKLTQLLKFLGSWLWVLPVALAAVAVWIARGRRLSILRMIAAGTVLAGLAVLVARRPQGSYGGDELVASATVQPAVQNAWDILTAQLRDGGFTLLGLGLVLLLGSWLGGASSSARAARSALAPYLARPQLAYGTVALLFLLLLWWQPTVQTSRGPLMLAAAGLLVLATELLRRLVAGEALSPATPDSVGGLRERVARRGQSARDDDTISRLERLAGLHERGSITDEEYAAHKAALTGG